MKTINRLSFFLSLSLSGSLAGSKAVAFDPTALGGAIATGNGLIGGMGALEEAADIGFALTELLEETGIHAEEDPQLNRTIKRLEDLNRTAKDLDWSGMQIHQALTEDLAKANSVQDKLRALRSMLSATKRIAEIIQKSPKAGQRALSIQEIRINSMILDELQSMRRAQTLAYLQDEEVKKRRTIYFQTLKQKSLRGTP